MDLEWTCHHCGATRPDAWIGVAKRRHAWTDGASTAVHQRYCLDRNACLVGVAAKLEAMVLVMIEAEKEGEEKPR